MEEEDDLETGTCFDNDKNYEVLCKLGGGAYGTCFAVRKDQNLYALKVFKPLVANGKCIETEINNLEKAVQPLSCKIIETYKTRGDRKYWILMDYIPGIPLSSFAYRKERSPWIVFFESWALCQSVALLHENCVIHRDIKPENIVVDAAFIPHLLDYGDATDVDSSGYNTIRTGEHGSINYAAPEVFGGSVYSVGTDIYSLGGTIFALATGKAPFYDFVFNRNKTLSYDFLTEEDKSRLQPYIDDEKPKRWKKTADAILKEKIMNGLFDTTHDKESENYKNLPEYYQELIKIVYECWEKEAEKRPKPRIIAEKIMEASKTLNSVNMDMFLASVQMFNKGFYKKENFGEIENVKNTAYKFGCVSMKKVIQKLFIDDPDFDPEDVECDFINSISSITSIKF